MVMLRPEQTLVSYQTRLITVDGLTTGNTLIDSSSSNPLFGQLSGWTPPPLAWATRMINAGFGPRPVYLHPEHQQGALTSHRFTGDWEALVMHLLNIRFRGVLMDGSLAPAEANPNQTLVGCDGRGPTDPRAGMDARRGQHDPGHGEPEPIHLPFRVRRRTPVGS